MPLEDFVTKAHQLVDGIGYKSAVKDTPMRDTLVFEVMSDKVCKDVIVLENSLTFNEAYNLDKVEESPDEGYHTR